MIDSILGASALVGRFSKSYMSFAGVVGLTVVASTVGLADRPTDVLVVALRALDIPVPGNIQSISTEFAERGATLTTGAALLAVTALLWSAGFLHQDIKNFSRVRGPASTWIAVWVMAEASGSGTVVRAFSLAMLVTLALIMISACRAKWARYGAQARDEHGSLAKLRPVCGGRPY